MFLHPKTMHAQKWLLHPHFEPTKFGAHISSYTQLLSGSSDYYVTALQLLNLNEPPNLDAQPTTQSQRNEMSHNYHGENRLSDEVVGDFSNNEDEIMTINDDNNINENDDNDIQFLFQPMTTENVYRPYPNCIDVGDNQVVENPYYRHFLDLPQQFESHDGELYVG